MNHHVHNWLFDRSTCCFVLKCAVTGCCRATAVTMIRGFRPLPGEPVRILEDGKTMERIGTRVD